jgi:hypothetical protein
MQFLLMQAIGIFIYAFAGACGVMLAYRLLKGK